MLFSPGQDTVQNYVTVVCTRRCCVCHTVCLSCCVSCCAHKNCTCYLLIYIFLSYLLVFCNPYVSHKLFPLSHHRLIEQSSWYANLCPLWPTPSNSAGSPLQKSAWCGYANASGTFWTGLRCVRQTSIPCYTSSIFMHACASLILTILIENFGVVVVACLLCLRVSTLAGLRSISSLKVGEVVYQARQITSRNASDGNGAGHCLTDCLLFCVFPRLCDQIMQFVTMCIIMNEGFQVCIVQPSLFCLLPSSA